VVGWLSLRVGEEILSELGIEESGREGTSEIFGSMIPGDKAPNFSRPPSIAP